MINTQAIIQKAEPRDAPLIREIAVEAEIDAWSEADYLAEIERDGSFVLKALVGGIVCGFLLARMVPGKAEHPDIDLYNIAVRPDQRRHGMATALIAEIVSRLEPAGAANIWLEVRESNIGAIKFYEKNGFTTELTRPRFYRDPIENAVIMRLKLAAGDDINST